MIFALSLKCISKKISFFSTFLFTNYLHFLSLSSFHSSLRVLLLVGFFAWYFIFDSLQTFIPYFFFQGTSLASFCFPYHLLWFLFSGVIFLLYFSALWIYAFVFVKTYSWRTSSKESSRHDQGFYSIVNLFGGYCSSDCAFPPFTSIKGGAFAPRLREEGVWSVIDNANMAKHGMKLVPQWQWCSSMLSL